MNFSILRTKKLKSFGAVARSARHTFREQPTPNADPNPLRRNRTVGASGTRHILQKLRESLPEKRRRDAVLCIEYLVTASPESFKRYGGRLDDLGGGYFSDALSWLKKRHGSENVLSATLHLDESTPHLVAYVVPRTKDGRLSCRDFLGGPTKLREMQDSFYASCGAKHGLERGVRGSKAKHEEVSAFYSTMTAVGDVPQLSFKDYAGAAFGRKTDRWRQAEALAKANAQRVALAARTRKVDRSRRERLEELAKRLDERQQISTHREIVYSSKVHELDQRLKSVESREKEVLADAGRVLALEAERDTLLRRLGMLEALIEPKGVAPKRGLVLNDEASFSH